MSTGDQSDRASLGRVGFESGSDVYERARPGYPEDSIAYLMATAGIIPGSTVLDLAAGTGKLTRQLHAAGATCLAVEPSASMREVFGQVVPEVPLIGGTAEMIPLVNRSVDAVVVAQAFHWFDPPRALPEIARVLRTRGWLSLIWNERDESDPMVAELVRISKWDQCQPYPMGMDFGPIIDGCGLFRPVTRAKFSFVQSVSATEFVDQVATRSYVRVLPDRQHQALLDQVAELATTLDDPIQMPYVTDLFCAQKTH